MILLPYKSPEQPRKRIGYIRYIVFTLSFLFVGALLVLNVSGIHRIMFWSFIIGNILYYAAVFVWQNPKEIYIDYKMAKGDDGIWRFGSDYVLPIQAAVYM